MTPVAQLLRGLRLTAVLWLLTVVVITLPMLALARIVAPHQAEGSLLQAGGRVVGSSLVGQAFTSERYLKGRPSAVDYGQADPPASGPSNLAPSNPALTERIAKASAAWGIRGVRRPAPDLLYASGSGLDPHISLEAARQQLGPIARTRGSSEARLADLLARHTVRPLGAAPLVNVLEFNLDLDQADRGAPAPGRPRPVPGAP